MSALAYRPEIDGLRAVAIAPVVLFHANLGLSGGYVGVDVFFVISGFLIGSIILRDLESGRFHLGQFLLRRVRRLFPAWSIMAIATAVAGYLLLMPSHLRLLGESIVAQPLLIANFHFYEQFGYFAAESETLPLLHTWSLAVEEQFYLFLPLIAIFCFRRGRGRRSFALVTVGAVVASFIASVVLTPAHPDFAFYLPFTRIWELGLGVGLGLIGTGKWKAGRGTKEALMWIGLTMILVPVFVFDANTVFPGTAAALPCLGTVLTIFSSAGESTFPTRILQMRPLVWLGKISYPLYLFHWPVIVFVHYYTVEDPHPLVWLPAIVGMLVLSSFVYRFVETPVRTRRVLASTPALLGAVALILVPVVGAGIYFDSSKGVPNRFPDSMKTFEARLSPVRGFHEIDGWESKGGPPSIGAKEGGPRLLLWGDSHARAVAGLLGSLGKEHGVEVVAAVQSGSPPLLGTYALRGHDSLLGIPEEVRKLLETENFDAVVLVGRWPLYLDGGGSDQRLLRSAEVDSRTPEEAAEVFEQAYAETLAFLAPRTDQVWTMQAVAEQESHVPEMLMRLASRNRDLDLLSRPTEEFRRRDAAVNERISRIASEAATEVLDPFPFFTSDEGIYRISLDGRSLYWDEDHLSQHGAELLRPLFEPIFESISMKEA